jgi:hypothetical protein
MELWAGRRVVDKPLGCPYHAGADKSFSVFRPFAIDARDPPCSVAHGVDRVGGAVLSEGKRFGVQPARSVPVTAMATVAGPTDGAIRS